ncbi:MAG TPA: TIGR00730 family Rossman fold protein [Alphaproteobacteria bacterium]|nr:TIGR00730 family Rossman fold protein [Alphaproteobacteria bacterium]
MRRLKSICVYCGSSNRGPSRHQKAALELGRRLAEAGVELVFGGGRVGLMGRLADGALSAGGRVTGVIPEHLIRAEVGHARVTRLVVTKSMHQRKAAMFRRSDGFVILPGGPGTLDEFFEIVTWRQLRLHDKPIVIVDLDGYWRPLLRLIERIIERGYARAGFRRLFSIVDGVSDVLPALHRAHRPRVRPRARRL